ncbi:MAG TPA: OmpA family protein, partial [Nevskiaceae bacterium]|nr:OmpA family protein [Nevskiaceae bacterium]
VVCAWGAASTAHAFEDQKYVGLMGLYYLPDSAFDLDDGGGARGYFGIPVNPNLNIELNAFGYGADPDDETVAYVKQYGGGVDLMAPLTQGSKFTPFFLLGGGYDRAEVGGSRLNNGFANAGLGALVDLGGGWGLRGEARYVALWADKDIEDSGLPDENRFDDVTIGLGFQYQFQKPAPPPPPPAPPPPPPAPKDTDGDGVLDTVDQCPNTPRGVQVDVRGCPLDSDGDGVPDYLDKCPNTPRGLRVDATGCVSEAQTIVLQNVNFEFNKDTLTAQAQDVLRGVAKGLVSQPSMRVEIAGHTDSKGSDAYNQRLSERRAASVRTFLIGQGVTSSQLSSKGYGEKQPVASNETDEGRAQNRRVEFRVLKK